MEAIELALTDHQVLSCIQIEDETIRIMHRKFARTLDSNRRRLSSFLDGAIHVEISRRLAGVCRDPKDDFILECASIGNADCIVTGDKDLLSLKTYRDIEILTPRQYLDKIQNRSTASENARPQ